MNNLCKLFFVLVLTLITDISTLNWFEAQEQCRESGGLTIESNKSIQPYWTGRYKRITPFIKIKGCFNDSFLSDLNTELYINVSISKNAVGICQETCQRKNTKVFAIKGFNCVCIKDVSSTFWPSFVNPSNCNFTCFNRTNNVYKNECGGNSFFNVFEEFKSSCNLFPDVVVDNKKRCLSLQCSREDTRFIPHLCSDPLFKVCQIQDSDESAKSWTHAMMDCKTAMKPSYLLGDLRNATIACNEITQAYQLGWVGIAQQVYINRDDGFQFREDEKLSFLKCQTCHQTKCKLKSCNEEIMNPVFCANQHQHVITEQTRSPSSSSLETNASLNEPTTLISNYITRYTTEQEIVRAVDGDSELVIIITVTAVLGVVMISAAMLIFYLRRKRFRQSEAPKEKTTENPSNKTVCTEERKSSNNPYFVLEKDSHGISSRSQIITESPYNDTEEGEYDHLREIRSRKDEEEDTYQHASVGIQDDVSNYDTMANTAFNKIPDEGGTYDHAHPNTNRNSDYGYNVTIHASLNDSPYDIAERK